MSIRDGEGDLRLGFYETLGMADCTYEHWQVGRVRLLRRQRHKMCNGIKEKSCCSYSHPLIIFA